jgi:uncharacterized membrane protein YkgB
LFNYKTITTSGKILPELQKEINNMKTTQYFFLLGAVIELIAGVALLAVYNNSLGYMGLIASAMMMAFIPLSKLAE